MFLLQYGTTADQVTLPIAYTQHYVAFSCFHVFSASPLQVQHVATTNRTLTGFLHNSGSAGAKHWLTIGY